MSASRSDSWILIALTILVVLLLFYLSKKMICNSYGSSGTEDSPTTSPSSTTSTSTSFSDYLYGGCDGRSQFDLIDAAGATTTSYGSSPLTDDLAIDITDSLSYSGDENQNHHFRRVDNQCSSNNNNNGINNNHNCRNNLDLSNYVTSNQRRMSYCGGRGVPCENSSSSIDNNSRGMDFGGSPPTSSASPATTTGSQQSILSPISIIAGPALDRKTMLETQLRNQIAKIVQAEREIQRLVQLLSLEQRQGWDEQNNNMLAAARATLLQHRRRYPQFYHHHLRGIIPPPISSVPLTNTPSTASSTTTGLATPVVVDADTVETSTLDNNGNNTKNNNIPSLSPENVSANEVATSAVDGDNDHYQNNTTETTSPGNHHHHLCHRHHHRNENCQSFSDLLMNSSSVQDPTPHQQQQQMLSCGLDASSIATFPHQGYSIGNVGTRAGRMLMLRRILLPISSYPISTNANATFSEGATRLHGDFLTRPSDLLACDLHHPREQQQHHRHWQPVPDTQSGLPDYSHQHQRDNYDHQQQHQPDDDPPPYEECIHDRNSYNSEDYNQNSRTINHKQAE